LQTFAYQYAVGGVVFLVGLWFGWRQGYLGLSGRPGRNLMLLVLGLGFFAGLQGILQFAPMTEAPAQPYRGDGLPTGVKGTPIDYGVMVTYFLAILAIGTWFSRRQKTSKDFFFGGQRFAWWLIAFSLIATTIGSYSFVKYSKVAYGHGLASSQTYLNDFFWVPLFIFGWLPIIYFSRIVSIPEYFERRFDRRVRMWATVLILIYLVGYVGVNLFTMGKALETLLGWPILSSAILVATISAVYVTAGGQTSVIMTDLFQGVMLLATGVLIVWLGAEHLGGIVELWENLPREHRTAFPGFADDPSFNGVGIFWQDAIANTAVFYFLNQGVMMRFLAARSVTEGRKAIVVVPMILMPIAAIVVASGGLVGRALEHAGVLPPDMDGGSVFFIATEFLSRTPGLFGLIMAALTAALMSTVDTLITAVAAIAVNDVYKPYIRPDASDGAILRVARITSVVVTLLGIALVPVFMEFDSIYEAHAAFTAAITPPLVVTLLCSVFWRRFTAPAAIATLAGGLLAMVVSIVWPDVITPFAHGTPMTDVGDDLLAGAKQYQFIRAFYGIVVCLAIAIGVTLFTRPTPAAQQAGLVWGTIAAAIRRYKGRDGREGVPRRARARVERVDGPDVFEGEARLPRVGISAALARTLDVAAGDPIHVSDTRAWLGGLRSAQVVVGELFDGDEPVIRLGPDTYERVVTPRRSDRPVVVEALY
jgi:solute:Na+ symporter, SSS family